jgi:predicted HTH domain antitoxin
MYSDLEKRLQKNLSLIMQLTLDIPDKFQQLDQAKNSLSQQVRLLSALLLFQSGQLSRGAACEFADVDIYVFLAACKTHNISVVNIEPDDLESDLLRFNQKHPE